MFYAQNNTLHVTYVPLTTDGHLITKTFISNAMIFYTNRLLPNPTKTNEQTNEPIKKPHKQNKHLNLLKSK